MLDTAHCDEITERYRCTLATCPNHANNGVCWVADGRVHLRILPNQARAWSMAINNGDATIESPTSNFLQSLMPARQGQRNPYRAGASATPASAPPPQEELYRSQYNPFHPLPLPYYFAPPPYPGSPYGAPPMPGHIAQRSPGYSSKSNLFSSPGQHTLSRSSPPLDPDENADPLSRLIKYTGWLARMSPMQAATIKDAEEKLVQQSYSFRTLNQISDDSFKRLEIPDGIVLLLKSEIDAFKRAERQGKV